MSRVGIEVEVESHSINIHDAMRALDTGIQRAWHVERDGSLRGGSRGFEVKSRGPTELEDVPGALAQLYPVIAGSSGSWRAAVHVHVDCTGLYWNKRALALALAYTLDLPLFNMFSPERVESNFCVPLSHKQYGVFDCIDRMARSNGVYRYGKYSSINIGRMDDLGTMEFRHMRTPQAGDSVRDVALALEQIQNYARACSSIVDAARGLRLNSRVEPGDELANKFIELIENFGMHAPDFPTLRPTAMAVGEVLPVLANAQSYDITRLDLSSVVRVVPTDERLHDESLGERMERFMREHRYNREPPEPDDEFDVDEWADRAAELLEAERDAELERIQRRVEVRVATDATTASDSILVDWFVTPTDTNGGEE